jgi:hypothetical protein
MGLHCVLDILSQVMFVWSVFQSIVWLGLWSLAGWIMT